MNDNIITKPDPSNKTAYNKWYYRQHKPFPVKLGDYKIPMMQFSNQINRSLHYVLLKAVEEFCENHGIGIDSVKPE